MLGLTIKEYIYGDDLLEKYCSFAMYNISFHIVTIIR